jgi:hypothetical protein
MQEAVQRWAASGRNDVIGDIITTTGARYGPFIGHKHTAIEQCCQRDNQKIGNAKRVTSPKRTRNLVHYGLPQVLSLTDHKVEVFGLT